MVQDDTPTGPSSANGSVKPERSVVVQEQRDVASEAEDGQEHDEGGEEVVQEDDDENDGTETQGMSINGRLF